VCPCGAARLRIAGKLLARFVCHCAICQHVYQAPRADVSAFWAGAIVVDTPATVTYRKYRAPPALQRGTCTHCGAPVAGFIRLAPWMRLAFVPSSNLSAMAALPRPGAHVFYHRRVAECAYDIPKHSGYWRSELAVLALVLTGVTR
jgi:hypothetical protein